MLRKVIGILLSITLIAGGLFASTTTINADTTNADTPVRVVLNNASFETGDYTGWTGNISVVGSAIETYYKILSDVQIIKPINGDYFVVLTPGGEEGVENFEDNYTTLSQTIYSAQPGDVVSGYANFICHDYDPHLDHAEVVLKDSNGNETVLFSAVVAPIDNEVTDELNTDSNPDSNNWIVRTGDLTGWDKFEYRFTKDSGPAPYILQARVTNIGEGSSNANALLAIDGINTNTPVSAEAGGTMSWDYNPVGEYYTTTVGSSIMLTGSGKDPTGGTLSYNWNLDGDSNNTFETPGQTVLFSAVGKEPGNYEVKLQVTNQYYEPLTATPNDIAQAVDTAYVHVADLPFSAVISLLTAKVEVGKVMTGSGIINPASGSSATDYTASVDYGDSTVSDKLDINSDFTFNLSHTYANSGTFTIKVTVTYGANTYEVIKQVKVLSAGPDYKDVVVNVNYHDQASGTVFPSGTLSIANGTSLELVATPEDGSIFGGWSGDVPADQKLFSSISFIVNENRDISAEFYPASSDNVHTLDILTDNNGVVEVNSDQTAFYKGTVVQLTAVADQDYILTDWIINGVSYKDTHVGPLNNPLLLTMDQDNTVEAVFDISPVPTSSLTVNPGSNGAVRVQFSRTDEVVTQTKIFTIADGTPVTLTATSNSGYLFSGWIGDNTGTENVLELNINDDTSITANYVAAYTISVTAEPNNAGTVSVVPVSINAIFSGNVFAEGTEVGLTAEPAEGYEFTEWQGAGTVSESGTIIIDGSKTITAIFTQISTPDKSFENFEVTKMMITWKNWTNNPNTQCSYFNGCHNWFWSMVSLYDQCNSKDSSKSKKSSNVSVSYDTTQADSDFQAWGYFKLPEGVTLENLQKGATITLTIPVEDSNGNTVSQSITFEKVKGAGKSSFWLYNNNVKAVDNGSLGITYMKIWWAPENSFYSGWAGFHVKGIFDLSDETIGRNTEPASATLGISIPEDESTVNGEDDVYFWTNGNNNEWHSFWGGSWNSPYDLSSEE